MPILFETTDPEGTKVICTEAQWNEHVVDRHQYMNGKDKQAKETIEQPDAIYKDEKHLDRNVYYRKQPNKKFYLKVVVRIAGGVGEVITAFPADKLKAGEKIIWSSKP